MVLKDLFRQRKFLTICQVVVRGKSTFCDGTARSTHNDLPIPEGDWNEWYAKRNKKGNLWMFSGIAALLGAIGLGVVLSKDVMKLNFFPPEHWEMDEEEKKEEEIPEEEQPE